MTAGKGAIGVVGTDAIGVVGASLAGVNAARALRQQGFAGPVVVFGGEPHRPYDRPPLSKEILQGRWDRDRATLRSHEHDLAVEWRLGTTVRALDAGKLTLTTDRGTETFPGGIVLATGATPRRLPGDPIRGVHVLRTLDDAVTLAAELTGDARVVVVGGGFIGGEVAASARSLGLDVTMLEMTAVPFSAALGADVGSAVAEMHRARGVEVLGGTRVVGVHGDERVRSVELDDGRTIPADVVVLGLGVAPATQWLEGSGLTLDDGVVCDETLLAAPGVVAAGDVARWPDPDGRLQRLEHWDNAIRQGAHAARRLLAEHDGSTPEPYRDVPWMWSDQYDVKLQLYGTTRGHDEVQLVHGTPEEGRFVALYRRGEHLVGALGVNRNRQVAQFRPLLARQARWDEALSEATASR